MKLFKDEQIKDIPGYEGLYAATTEGRIWSYPSKSNVNKNGLWLKPGGRGRNQAYKGVVLRKVSSKSISVHKLIAMTFMPNPDPEKYNQINHINGIKYDNRLSNLEWCDGSYNSKHAYDNGTHSVTDKVREKARENILKLKLGEKRRLLTMDQAVEIRAKHKTRWDTKKLAKQYNVGMHIIRRIVNGDSYTE